MHLYSTDILAAYEIILPSRTLMLFLKIAGRLCQIKLVPAVPGYRLITPPLFRVAP
jgi:hypothetical protein